MTGTDLCVNKSQFVSVIFEPPCILNVIRCTIVMRLMTGKPKSSQCF
jgi:hypothetical protein